MRVVTFLLACTAWGAFAVPSGAQPAASGPVARVDIHGSLGWANTQRTDITDYDDWDHGIATGGVGAGWYWTNHVKTEIELSAVSRAQFYRFERLDAGGQSIYRSSNVGVRAQGLSVAQLYQGLRNTWVHPFVGAGLDLRRETTVEDFDPVQFYDYNLRQPVFLEPARSVGPRTTLVARPFVVAGLKAYITERAFFRSDLRAGFGGHAREVVARAGFGIDF